MIVAIRSATCSRALALALLVFGGLFVVACEPAADMPAPPVETSASVASPEADLPNAPASATGDTGNLPGAPVMWTLADEDTTIHLFGTVHILKPDMQWRTPEFDAIFETVDTVIFEADVASPQAQQNMARLVPQLGVYSDGTRLSDRLEPDQAREVREALELIGVPMAAIEPMKPWLATVQISMQALVQQGYAPDSGVESILTEDARKAGKSFEFLETGEQQLRFFADMAEDDQIDFLVASAQQIEDNPNLLDDLVEDWGQGDIDEIARMMADPAAMGSPAVYDVLIVERNRNWTEQIADLMADKPGTFLLAVGAGHLAGPDSVAEMLRARGYEVKGP